MKQAKPRVIKVFISSTFRDMNGERDYLNKFVFPRVHQYCAERRIEFYPIDLRWGIQERDSKSGLVISSCLEQIDNSRPFFIGILGSRYGWIPSKQEIAQLRTSVKKHKPWLLSKIDELASITEIEIDYGALSNNNLAHACFMLRDEAVKVADDFQEDTDSIEYLKLAELKQKIKSQNRYPVYTYSSLEQFGERIYDELMTMIGIEFPESATDNEDAALAGHEYVLSRRSDTLCNIESVKSNCDKWLESGNQFLVIRGMPGYGTSTALAYFVSYLRSKYCSKIIYYDFEEGSMDGDVMDKFLSFMDLDCNQVDPQKWSLIALDNCTILGPSEVSRLLSWMESLSVNTHVAIAAALSSPADTIIQLYLNTPSITVHGFPIDARKEFIINYLHRYGKELSNEQLNHLASIDKTEDPTYLSFILNDLVNFGSFENLDEHMRTLVEKTKLGDMFSISIGTKAQEADLEANNCNYEFVKAMIILAQTRKVGISEQDLCAIADIPTGKWAIIRPYILKWCKGNKTKLVLIKPDWEHGIKQIWSTPWQAQIGEKTIDWFLENKNLVEAATAAASIWTYIWHLPIDNYKELTSKLFSLACSPDVVLGLDLQKLNWFFSTLLINFDIGRAKECFGRSIEQLSFEQTIEYYTRLAQAVHNLNSGPDTAYCYAQIAETYRKNGDQNLATCYQAQSYLAVGKAKAAIATLKPLIIEENKALSWLKPKKIYTDEQKQISLMALCISCRASALSGDMERILEKFDKISKKLDKIDSAERELLKLFCELYIDTFALACYSRDEQTAFTIAESIDNNIEYNQVLWIATSLSCCAKYKLCTAISHLFVSKYDDNKRQQLEISYNDSCRAECLAWLSGTTYIQNQAAILGDYIYFKTNGKYRPGQTQIYTNAYCPPREYCRTLKHHRLKPFDWSQVDVEVREWIVKERDFYRGLIYEIQPEFVRKEMDAEEDQLRKELLL